MAQMLHADRQMQYTGRVQRNATVLIPTSIPESPTKNPSCCLISRSYYVIDSGVGSRDFSNLSWARYGFQCNALTQSSISEPSGSPSAPQPVRHGLCDEHRTLPPAAANPEAQPVRVHGVPDRDTQPGVASG